MVSYHTLNLIKYEVIVLSLKYFFRNICSDKNEKEYMYLAISPNILQDYNCRKYFAKVGKPDSVFKGI